jgi:hypothetical protein
MAWLDWARALRMAVEAEHRIGAEAINGEGAESEGDGAGVGVTGG